MSENEPQNAQLKVVSREQIRTDFGVVERLEVVFRGSSRTVYSSAAWTAFGLERYAAEIEDAEKCFVDPMIGRNFAADGRSPEEFVEMGSRLFIEDLRTCTYSVQIQEHALSPLIKQRALGRLFDQARRAQSISQQ